MCGSYPYWLFMTNRGALRAHPMNIDGAVTCFTPFHNINCPKGFLYFNKKVLTNSFCRASLVSLNQAMEINRVLFSFSCRVIVGKILDFHAVVLWSL